MPNKQAGVPINYTKNKAQLFKTQFLLPADHRPTAKMSNVLNARPRHVPVSLTVLLTRFTSQRKLEKCFIREQLLFLLPAIILFYYLLFHLFIHSHPLYFLSFKYINFYFYFHHLNILLFPNLLLQLPAIKQTHSRFKPVITHTNLLTINFHLHFSYNFPKYLFSTAKRKTLLRKHETEKNCFFLVLSVSEL